MEPKSAQEFLKSISLDDKAIADVLKNAKLTQTLTELGQSLAIQSLDKKQGNLFYSLVSKGVTFMSKDFFNLIGRYIADGKITTNAQLDEAFTYYKENSTADTKSAEFIKTFEERCGVGVSYTPEQIQEFVKKFVKENAKEIAKKPKVPALLAKLKEGLKFADFKELIAVYDVECKSVDPALAAAEPKAEAKPKEAAGEAKEAQKNEEEEEEALLVKYRTEKFLARDLGSSLNDPEVLKAHKARTQDKVVTRFPPEPNGYLHIGHCKAVRFSFKVAQDHDGYTYLRYDDTNPEAESQEYIDTIRNTVNWLGYTPKYITYASDNFDKIYETAIKLIKMGKAYVCKLSKEDAKAHREEGKPSPYRDSDPATNLREFQLMKAGFYAEKEACLRAKIDYLSPNPTLRDPTIYRIKYTPHPHLGNKWCIYPLYDFVHSLCDSFEDITHSLCTLEFENRRELYYWSLSQLNMYKPFVWEFSRLNIGYNVLSKRKLIEMLKNKLIDGWDDPRLFTVVGLRRRGYPAEAINNFCDLISVTRRGNDNVIQYGFLEHCIRQYLMKHAPKTFAVIEPALLELTNETGATQIDEKGLYHNMYIGKQVYIEKSDVKLVDSKDFFGIAPGKIVRLKYGPFVRINTVEEDGKGSFIVKGETLPLEKVENPKKVKGVLHFVEKEHAINVEVRNYERLFTAEYPGERTGNFLDDFNHDSKKVFKNAKIWKEFAPKLVKEGKYQFERLGFFSVDYDTDLEGKRYVFNKTVGFKESDKIKELKAK